MGEKKAKLAFVFVDAPLQFGIVSYAFEPSDFVCILLDSNKVQFRFFVCVLKVKIALVPLISNVACHFIPPMWPQNVVFGEAKPLVSHYI
jgi:hypothetical protein